MWLLIGVLEGYVDIFLYLSSHVIIVVLPHLPNKPVRRGVPFGNWLGRRLVAVAGSLAKSCRWLQQISLAFAWRHGNLQFQLHPQYCFTPANVRLSVRVCLCEGTCCVCLELENGVLKRPGSTHVLNTYCIYDIYMIYEVGNDLVRKQIMIRKKKRKV